MKNNLLIKYRLQKSTLIIFLIVVGFIFGYEFSEKKDMFLTKNSEITMSGNQINESDDELQKRILINGDSIAYDKLHIKHFGDKYSGATLLYDIIMANKFGYPEAFYRVYNSLIFNYERENNYGKIDNKSLELALQYLNKGVELNNLSSISTISNLYREGVYIKRDSVKSVYYDKKATKIMSE